MGGLFFSKISLPSLKREEEGEGEADSNLTQSTLGSRQI